MIWICIPEYGLFGCCKANPKNMLWLVSRILIHMPHPKHQTAGSGDVVNWAVGWWESPEKQLDNDDNVIPEVIINEVSKAAAQLMRASHHLMLHFHVLEFHRTMKSTWRWCSKLLTCSYPSSQPVNVDTWDSLEKWKLHPAHGSTCFKHLCLTKKRLQFGFKICENWDSIYIMMEVYRANKKRTIILTVTTTQPKCHRDCNLLFPYKRPPLFRSVTELYVAAEQGMRCADVELSVRMASSHEMPWKHLYRTHLYKSLYIYM